MFDIAQSMKEAAEERKENRMVIEQMANVILNKISPLTKFLSLV